MKVNDKDNEVIDRYIPISTSGENKFQIIECSRKFENSESLRSVPSLRAAQGLFMNYIELFDI